MNDASDRSPMGNTAAQSGGGRSPFWRFFWLAFLVGSLGYAWYCFYVPANDVAWAEDVSSAGLEAARTDKPMVLFFTGVLCVPCRIMKRTVFADDAVAATVNAAFVPVMIDVGEPDAAEVLARYGVGPTPLTIITDPSGEVLRYRQGGMDKAEFLELLAEPEGSDPSDPP